MNPDFETKENVIYGVREVEIPSWFLIKFDMLSLTGNTYMIDYPITVSTLQFPLSINDVTDR